MRDILFRGKNKVTKEWVIGDLFHHDKQLFISAENHVTEVDPETVGQYTGIIDRNGEKIFEGDIVHGYSYGFDGIGNIIWIDKIASFGMWRGHDIAWENCSILKRASAGKADDFTAEVIGNIHDNPELLKGS